MRKEVFELLKPGSRKFAFAAPQSRGAVGLMALGIVMGLATATGIAPGNVFVLLGAMGACTAGRFFLTERRDASAPLWLMTMGWSMLAVASRFGTTDLEAIAGAQAVLGPVALLRPPVITGVSVAAVGIGLLAGVFWIQSQPQIESENGRLLDAALAWGETALVGVGFTALAWGPVAGGLAYGPYSSAMLVRSAASLAVVVVLIVFVSWLRRVFRRLEGRGAATLLGPLSFASLVTSLLVR